MASRGMQTGARPILKWAGGKGRLCPEFDRRGLIPQRYGTYIEPFAGGAALFFYLRPKKAILIDTNEELINLYRVVRDEVDHLVEALRELKESHAEEFFYEVRSRDPSTMDPVARAARMVYLNKTCFNGLYRVNSRGLFNVPFGRYRNPTILDEANLRAASRLLSAAELIAGDFEKVSEIASSEDFVYFDPPYDPVSTTSNFTSYSEGGFGKAQQARLAQLFSMLAERGTSCLLSNSDTPHIRRLYENFHIENLAVPRFINSKGDGRGRVGEVAVTSARLGRGVEEFAGVEAVESGS